MRTLLLLLSGVTVLFMASVSAHACQCLIQAPASTDYWRADAVFVGSVTDIVPSFDALDSSLRTKNRKVTLSVETAYRGSVGGHIDLQDWINSCEFRFEKGHRYLIYAYRNTDDNSLGTHGCSRTSELSYAKEDIEYINALRRGTVRQTISGIIQDPVSERPVAGMTVIAINDGRELKSVSDRKGNFEILVDKGGHYTVKIYLPSAYSIGGPAPYIDRIKNVTTTSQQTIVEYDLNLVNGQCEYLVIPAVRLGP